MPHQDPLLDLWTAFRAHMSERTGLTWAQVESVLRAEQEFWTGRPAARALIQETEEP